MAPPSENSCNPLGSCSERACSYKYVRLIVLMVRQDSSIDARFMGWKFANRAFSMVPPSDYRLTIKRKIIPLLWGSLGPLLYPGDQREPQQKEQADAMCLLMRCTKKDTAVFLPMPQRCLTKSNYEGVTRQIQMEGLSAKQPTCILPKC